ncbi:MarR family transcriptional regulator [Streptomyces rubiginosohelvolus]|uniref:MarR family transcriptional regulator n=1 Tax=Streptomyces rubiginosohelvolus TaxID=67362 RepID=UPI0033AA0E89
MVTQHLSSAPHAPAASSTYPMAKPGYGKRTAPGQQARARDDFALLPTRERYVAGFVDHLPDGAAMSVKQLAKQLPLYGQQAISTALKALSVAGHLRRVRCSVGAGDESRWVFRTFWSRTARDNEWWNTYLATENASRTAAPVEPPAPAAVPQQRTAPEPTPDPAPAPAPAPASTPTAPPAAFSPAYLALARLGRNDHRLGLSADDCTTLEPLAAQWLDRGVTTDYLTRALTAGLPAQIDSPAGLLRRRLIDKLPPRLPDTTSTPANTPTPTRRLLVECTDCRRPGPPEALPDGLCHPCHTTHSADGPPSPDPTQITAVKAHMANLRDLLKPV